MTTTTSHTPEPLEGLLKDAVCAVRESKPPANFGAKVLAEAAAWKAPVSRKPTAAPASRGPLMSLITAAIAASLFFIWFTGAPPRKFEFAKGPETSLQYLAEQVATKERSKQSTHDSLDANSAELQSQIADATKAMEHFDTDKDAKMETFSESPMGDAKNRERTQFKLSEAELQKAQLDDAVRVLELKQSTQPDVNRFSRTTPDSNKFGAPPAENMPQDPKSNDLGDMAAGKDSPESKALYKELASRTGRGEGKTGEAEARSPKEVLADAEKRKADEPVRDAPSAAPSRSRGAAGFGGGGPGGGRKRPDLEADRAPPVPAPAEPEKSESKSESVEQMERKVAGSTGASEPAGGAAGAKPEDAGMPPLAVRAMPPGPVKPGGLSRRDEGAPSTLGLAANGAIQLGANPTRRVVVAADATRVFTTGDVNSVAWGDEVAYSEVNLLHVMDWSKDTKSEVLGDIGPVPFTATPDGNSVLSASGALFEVLDKKVERLDAIESKDTRALTVAPDGKRLLTQHVADNYDCYFALSELPSGEEKFKIPNQWGYTFAAGFSPDNDAFALMDKDKIVHEFSLTDGAKLKTYEPAHVNSIRAIEYSPNGKMLASTGTRGETYLWSRADATLIHKLEIAQTPSVHALDGLTTIRFSPDSRFLAASGSSNIFFWNVATGKIAAQLEPGSGDAIHLRYSADGTKITAVKDFIGVQDAEGRETLKYPTVKEWDVPADAR